MFKLFKRKKTITDSMTCEYHEVGSIVKELFDRYKIIKPITVIKGHSISYVEIVYTYEE